MIAHMFRLRTLSCCLGHAECSVLVKCPTATFLSSLESIETGGQISYNSSERLLWYHQLPSAWKTAQKRKVELVVLEIVSSNPATFTAGFEHTPLAKGVLAPFGLCEGIS